MKASNILAIGAILNLTTHCNSSQDFQRTPKKKEVTSAPAPIEPPINEPQTSPQEAVDLSVNDPELCWFAVSGAHLGYHGREKKAGEYQPKFPGTTSGNSIAHGETFDTVGGVYLNASDTEYKYGQGNKELDLAIDYTFDSIAVAPGMKVVVKDKLGNILVDTAGPFIAFSTEYGYDSGAYVANILTKLEEPKWIKKYVAEVGIVRTALHPAWSVLVQKIPSINCDESSVIAP